MDSAVVAVTAAGTMVCMGHVAGVGRDFGPICDLVACQHFDGACISGVKCEIQGGGVGFNLFHGPQKAPEPLGKGLRDRQLDGHKGRGLKREVRGQRFVGDAQARDMDLLWVHLHRIEGSAVDAKAQFCAVILARQAHVGSITVRS